MGALVMAETAILVCSLIRSSRNLIYGLTDPISGAVRYIGQSRTGLTRPVDHARPSRWANETNHKANWIKGLIKSGLMYGVEILEVVEDEDVGQLDLFERYWIAQAREAGWPLTNLTDGGKGPNGCKYSNATKAKIRASLKGRVMSPEWRARISASKKGIGHPHTEESRRKISEAHMGKVGHPQSAESRSKISASLRRRKEAPVLA